MILLNKGTWKKEKKAYQEFYDLYEREPGEKNLFPLEVMNDLAGYYKNLGTYNIALQLYE
ncbi:hypothetical protein ACTQXK_00520 [Catenibacterium mitsuokai]|uniref:hypothetical protein n=1 Tax=Catenibacterium mitsuokai TaxID=100886 RepID=UPI003F91D998